MNEGQGGPSSSSAPELTAATGPDPGWIRALRFHFREWVLAPIRGLPIHERISSQTTVLSSSPDALVAFVLMSCAIRYFAGFWWGRSTREVEIDPFVGFIDAFFPAGVYDAEGLYDSLWNGLVHKFTTKGRMYALSHNRPHLHLKKDAKGQTILNAADFEHDLVRAANAYFQAAETSPDLMLKAWERYHQDGLIDHVPFHMV